MKHLFLIFGFLASMSLTAQSPVLTEDFNATIPAGWTQTPATSWTLNPTYGVAGSGCVMTQAATSLTRTISTPTLDLTGYTNLTVSFDAAIVQRNFMAPKVVLSYDAGTGPQVVARWGNGSATGVTYTISSGYQSGPQPLQQQNVSWQPCTHTLSPISGNTSAVQFIFDADMFNGGYVLLDNIVVSGTPLLSTGITPHHTDAEPFFANPVKGKQLLLNNAGQLKEALLFNAVGQQLLHQELHTANEVMQMNLENLPTGPYLLHLRMNDNHWIIKKIVLE